MVGGPPQPAISTRLFALPKAGHTLAEYEDAWALNPAAGHYALADGASDSAFAAAWAQALVRRFVQCPPAGADVIAWRAWLRPVQDEWQAGVQAQALPWYVAAKARQGAFATLIGLTIEGGPDPAGPGAWAAVGIGDSCLFHVPAPGPDQASTPPVSGFPLSDPQAFGVHPLALCSVPAPNEAVWPHLALTGGTWQPGDSFVLATDALAQWLMRAVTPRHWPLFLAHLLHAEDRAFAQLAESQRTGGLLRDDDLTLLIIRTESPGARPGGGGA